MPTTNTPWPFRTGIVLLALGYFPLAQAQEFTVLGGEASSIGLRADSYSWILDYRQGLIGPVEGSLSWINEGHVDLYSIQHHRDGIAGQLWVDLPWRLGGISVSGGVGADFFFDSKIPDGESGVGSVDYHNIASVFSLDLRRFLGKSQAAFVCLRATEIYPSHHDSNPNRTLLDFGVGYYFGNPNLPHATTLPPLPAMLTNGDAAGYDWAPTVLVGSSRINTFARKGSNAAGFELRHPIIAYFDVTVGYLYEGDTTITRRQGLDLQVWAMSKDYHYWRDHPDFGVLIGFGAGGYATINSNHVSSTLSRDNPGAAGLLTPTLALDFPGHLTARFNWDRVVTDYNKDADVWLFGLSYRFG